MQAVVDRQLFPWANPPPAEHQDVPPDNARPEIWIAAVIHELRARSSHGAVNSPVAVQLEHRHAAGSAIPADFSQPPDRLVATEPLSRVLDHLAARWNRFRCIHASAVDARAVYA